MDFFDFYSSPFQRKATPQYRSRPQYNDNPYRFSNPYSQHPQTQACNGGNPFAVNLDPQPEYYGSEVDDYVNPTETYDFWNTTRAPQQQYNRYNSNNDINTKRSSQCNVNHKPQKHQYVIPQEEIPQPPHVPESLVQEKRPQPVAEPKVAPAHHKASNTHKPIRIAIDETSEEKQQKIEKLAKQRNEAARRIQRWYNGASIRKLDIIPKLKKLSTIKQQVDKLYSNFSSKIFDTLTPPILKDVLVFEELLMQKMLNLDGITSQSDLVREKRKALTRHINNLLDQIETMKAKLKFSQEQQSQEQANENYSSENIQSISKENVNLENNVREEKIQDIDTNMSNLEL